MKSMLSSARETVHTVKERVEEEVSGDSSHTLYQLLSDILSRLQTLRRRWSEQMDNLVSRFDFRSYSLWNYCFGTSQV